MAAVYGFVGRAEQLPEADRLVTFGVYVETLLNIIMHSA